MIVSHFGRVAETAVKTLTASGAIVDTSLAILDGTSAVVATTLAAGQAGDTLDIVCLNATNAVTLVPSVLLGGTTITFTANDAVRLVYTGAAWAVVSNVGALIS